MTAPNGSEGRFSRIESKLDSLGEDVADLRVAVARIESSMRTTAGDVARRVSTQTYRWMIAGILLSFALGAATFTWRLVT